MNILIDNVGFVNKGAELMLCSIVEKLKQRYPDAQLLISYNSFIQGGFEYCCENNILPFKTGFISKLESIFYNLCIKKGLMSKKSIRYFIHSSNVGIIIDAAGFQYGDQWKHTTKTIKRVKKYYNSFKKGCKLVLLPQSFGPFERKESIETVNAVLKNTGLVYAREDISLNYLKNIACNKDNIIFKRDFTILYKKNTFINDLLKDKNYIVIIPNKKMITHSSFKNNEYLSFICSLVERLQKKGEIVYLLNHEGIGDKQICDTIKKSLNIDIPILTGLGATEVKNVIGNAKLVVSSRFHGVVSGIVQRVPTFCTSWSHKYNELLSVYGLDNNLLEIDSLDQSIEKLGDSLSNPDKYITKLEIVNQEIESTELMWSQIFKYLEN